MIDENNSGSGVEVTAKPGQLIRAKEVDEKNKPTAWEAVPWGYTEGGMVEIPVQGEWQDSSQYIITAPMGLEAGNTYTVVWNGVEYTATARNENIEGVSAVVIGNLLGESTEPFGIAELSAEAAAQMGMYGMACPYGETPGFVDFTIYHNAEIPHPIPGELLPGDVFNKDAVFGLTKKQTEMLPETNVEFGGGIKQRSYDNLPLEELNPGKYVVYWRGIPYECAAQYTTGSSGDLIYKRTVLGNASKLKDTAFGNIDEIDMSVDSGEPFVINAVFVQGTLVNVLFHRFDNEEYTEESISVQIFLIEEEPNKMPTKYLPDGVPYVEKGGMVEVLPETQTVAEDDGLILPAAPSLTGGETYTVKWNGTEYQCVAIDGADLGEPGVYALGDVYTMTGGNVGSEATGEPFVLLVIPEHGMTVVYPLAEFADGDPLPTVAIYQGGETIHKLDNRCLDLDWLPVKRTGKGTVLVPEQVSSSPMGYLKDANYEALHAGITEIIVTVDGVEHIYPVKIEETESPNYGYNISLATVGSSFENMPFAMQYRPNQTSENFAFSTRFKDGQTMSVHIAEQVVNKLPEEFLPEGVPYCVEERVQLAAEKTVTNLSTPNITETEGGFPDMTINDVYIGMPIVVCVNGVKYDCLVSDGGEFGTVAMGAGMPLWLTFRQDRTDVCYTDHTQTYIASVFVEKTEYNKLPTKLLPEGVPCARKTDTLTFDGSIEGKTAFLVKDGVYLVHISSEFVEATDLIGSTVQVADLLDEFEEDTFEITEDVIKDGALLGLPGYLIGEYVFVMREEGNFQGIALPKGISMMCMPGALWIREIKAPSKVFVEVVAKLHNACLDMDYIRGELDIAKDTVAVNLADFKVEVLELTDMQVNNPTVNSSKILDVTGPILKGAKVLLTFKYLVNGTTTQTFHGYVTNWQVDELWATAETTINLGAYIDGLYFAKIRFDPDMTRVYTHLFKLPLATS